MASSSIARAAPRTGRCRNVGGRAQPSGPVSGETKASSACGWALVASRAVWIRSLETTSTPSPAASALQATATAP